MDIARVVSAEIRALVRERGVEASHFAPGDRLTETLGLTSLEVMSAVRRLNAALEVDPFQGALAMTDMRTIGDLSAAYEAALSHAGAAAMGRDALRSSAQRAESRRKRSRS